MRAREIDRSRIKQIVDIAAAWGRRTTIVGRSMENYTEAARDRGYLTLPEGSLVHPKELDKIPDHEVCIITTGSQGEPTSALSRMALGDHRHVAVREGDTVVMSATPIPGNEELVSRTVDNLFKLGAEVIYDAGARPHVSGHASQEELKLLLNILRPRYFIPMHGEFRMQVQHGRLATETGVPPENVFIIENGTPIEFSPDGAARRGQPVPAGYVFVDGLSVGEVGEIVLRDRRALANDGMFMIVVTVDKQTGNVVGKPEIITRGFIHGDAHDRVVEAAVERVIASIENPGDHISEIALLKSQIKDGVSRFLYEQTKRRPMVFPVVVEV